MVSPLLSRSASLSTIPATDNNRIGMRIGMATVNAHGRKETPNLNERQDQNVRINNHAH